MIKIAVPSLSIQLRGISPAPQQFKGLGQLQDVDITSFTAAFDGALIPAFFGKKVVA
ncbi:MAG: hypothetical protein KKB91_08430 [Proteobacteria bacterium]|jgi:hypothetical protein|nr:hypothetical protein [Pseudomonadota bacterium]MBU4030404.1 hypothetical protein [Pseudomonadota bacterium]MBU4083762.1 hypothetical protein [Pseudomonadota bacterium]MBU4107324.1 hypothetical protein [Pseudomonadota bacterium]MBU4167439.1 hypothetical protein [Pseudomonadota bacterium]